MRLVRLAFALSVAVVLLVPLAAQNLEADLQRAIQKETVSGDLTVAIREYQEIANRSASNHQVAARALLRLAAAYEKRGDREAVAVYERILREYSDQKDAADIARARIGGQGTATAARQTLARQRWAGPGTAWVRSMAPDGRQVVFADLDTGDLALRDLVTGTDRRLTKAANPWTDHADAAVMSRDGRYIAYSWYVGSKGRYELRLLATDATSASSPKVLIDNADIGYVQPFEWSPDGRSIAAQVKREDNTAQIALIDSRDGTLRTLKTIDWRGVSQLAFSPDGRYLAFDLPVSDDARQRDVFVLSTDGSHETAVDARPGYDTALGWSPDGRSLLFTSDRSGATALWAVRMANGRPEGAATLLYADLGTFYGSLGVTADGTLAYIRKTGAVNVFSVAVDFATGATLGAPEQLTDSYLWNHGHPSWSPDGRFVAYPTLGQTTKAFVVRTLTTGQIRDITPKATNFSFPRWSADRYVVYQGSDLKGRQGIYRLDVETAEVSPVATGDGYLSWASSTRDGRLVVFGRNITGQPMALVVKDMTTGVERDLVRGAYPFLTGGTVSPDGRLVAYRTGDDTSSGIYVVPIAGGEPKEIVRATAPGSVGHFMDWLPDSRRVVLTRHEKGRSSVLVIPVDGGPPVELKLPAGAQPPLRVHPDGGRLSYLSGDSAVEVWTLENFLPAATSARK